MKLLDWQIKISSDYKGTPCNADVFLIQSEEFADSRNLARQWRPLTTGNLTVETLEDVMHEELSEGNPEPHYHVADAMNLHIEKLITEHML